MSLMFQLHPVQINMASPRFLFRPVREVAFRPRPQVSKRKITPIVQTRFASNVSGNDQKVTPIPEGEKPQGPNEGVSHSMHVSEEQKAYDKIQGNETSPDVNQGTPVQEVYFLHSASEHQANMYRSCSATMSLPTRSLRS